MRKLAIALALTVGMLSSHAYGFGNRGHQLVGAIADRKLQENPTVCGKIKTLLNGLDLQTVAVYPDVIIKTLDTTAPSNVFSRHPELADKAPLVADLTAFWEANHDKPLPAPHENRHRMAHYTDAPVMGLLKYQESGVGQTPFDIVHAIPRCIRVLQGKANADDADRKISKAVAVILLAHYVGDMHQPLHVGAEYFDFRGQPVDPAKTAGALEDTGGNDIHFRFSPPHHSPSTNLHEFWDEDAVNLAFPRNDDAANAEELARNEPTAWKLGAGVTVDKWAEAWATEILPVASAAHTAVAFDGISLGPHGKHFFQAELSGNTYPAFAGKTAKEEIHKAGWRLAALLEEILKD